MKHLVTGSSGFIGNLAASRLSERGEDVRLLDIRGTSCRACDLEFVNCSILNRDGVAAAMRGVDSVHHHAALVAQTDSGKLYWDVNVEGTRVVVEEAIKAGVKTFVHMSSTSVYGIPPSGAIKPDTPLRPVEPYGRSKLAAESIARELCSNHGTSLTIIRPRVTLGAGRLGIFQILFEWIAENKNVYVIGSGDIKSQFIHAHDLMDFYMLVLDAAKPGIYNVGTDRFGTLRSELESLVQYAGSESKVRSLPEAASVNALRALHWLRISPLVPWHYLTYHKDCYFDIEPLLRMGWRPKYSNGEMLEESYDWYRNNLPLIGGKLADSPHRSPVKQGILWLLKQLS